MVQKCSCAMVAQSNRRNSQILLASFPIQSFLGVLVAVASWQCCYLSPLDELILVGNGVSDEHAFTRTRPCVVQQKCGGSVTGTFGYMSGQRALGCHGNGCGCQVRNGCKMSIEVLLHTWLVAEHHLSVT